LSHIKSGRFDHHNVTALLQIGYYADSYIAALFVSQANQPPKQTFVVQTATTLHCNVFQIDIIKTRITEIFGKLILAIAASLWRRFDRYI
jgi:hypothetical protein